MPRKRLGHHLVICELSGFRFWDDEVVKTWDGMIVGKPFFENRHPQDFVRGTKDDQQVPDSRPEPAETHLIACNAEGRNGIAGYGIAGCSITGLELTR